MKASTVNKYNFIGFVIFFAIVLLFGIVFMFFAVKLNLQKIPENFIETEATITKIEEELLQHYDAADAIGVDDYEYTVFVEYSYGDKTYSDKEYGKYSSSMKEGDAVLVYVDPDAPDEFMSDPSGRFVYIIIGAVAILIGAGGLGYLIYNKKKEKD